MRPSDFIIALLSLTGLTLSSEAEPVFNGKDLTGWQGVQGEANNWIAADGVLTGAGGEGAQWLATTTEYDDFDLSLEFKLPENGNSGVFIRAPKEGVPYVDGIEIQLLDDAGPKWQDLQPEQFTGAIYAALAPSMRATKAAGEWQSLRVLCIGKSCQVWINEQQVIDTDLGKLAEKHGDKVPGLKRDRGHIGLQNHGDPVSFRNIDLRAIPTTGWIDLYNGRNLDGWHENKFKHQPEWRIIDGVLTGHGGQGYLSSLEKFADFELEAEARISDTAGGRGNSGIYFRCGPHTDLAQEFPPGYEAQLDHGDDNNPTGSIYNLNIEGSRAPKSESKDGEWVTMRIRAVGDHLQTWVNGKPAADCHDPDNHHREGSILLQMHHLTGKAEFRRVRIRTITP